jgi:hypothetical protein
LQHQQINVSSESLPPPPAYLLDRSQNQPNNYIQAPMTTSLSSNNVAGAVKTLTDLRHTPASPGVVRRQLSHSSSTNNNLNNNHHAASQHHHQPHPNQNQQNSHSHSQQPHVIMSLFLFYFLIQNSLIIIRYH